MCVCGGGGGGSDLVLVVCYCFVSINSVRKTVSLLCCVLAF